jgi:class 3 adenylate cyclase
MLDQADEAADRGDWPDVADIAKRVLALDPDNGDASALVVLATSTGDGSAIEQVRGVGPNSARAKPPTTGVGHDDIEVSTEAVGERRLVTVLFADAVGFTGMSEGLDEEDVYAVIQRCTAVMTESVQLHNGVVTQFLGDGLMALFGVPIALEQAELSAVTAALDMQRDLMALGDQLELEFGQRPRFRVGLNTGRVVVGSINDDSRWTSRPWVTRSTWRLEWSLPLRRTRS